MIVNGPHSDFRESTTRQHQRPGWRQSLVDTETGLRTGLRTDATIAIYFFVFSAVIAAAAIVGLSLLEWALIVLTLGAVLASRMFHCLLAALQNLLPADQEQQVRSAMQFGVAAVTVTNLSAFCGTALIILPRLIAMFG